MTAAQPMALRQALPWQQMQDGLNAWVEQYAGIPGMWTKIPGGTLQAPRAYCSIRLAPGVIRSLGLDGRGMQSLIGTLPAPPTGAEMAQVIFGLRAIRFQFEIFSDSKLLADNAVSYGEALRASLTLDSACALLLAAGLAANTVGDVQDLSDLQEATWVSRCLLEVGFTVAMFSAQGDRQGYVSEVVGDGHVKDGNQDGTAADAPFDVKGL